MIIRRSGSNDKDKKKKRKRRITIEEEVYEGPELPADQNPNPQAVSSYFAVQDIPRLE